MSGHDVAEILRRLDRQDETLQEIREQAKLTNGRVTTLELWRERALGHAEALSWRLPVALSVLGAALGAIAQAALT